MSNSVIVFYLVVCVVYWYLYVVFTCCVTCMFTWLQNKFPLGDNKLELNSLTTDVCVHLLIIPGLSSFKERQE